MTYPPDQVSIWGQSETEFAQIAEDQHGFMLSALSVGSHIRAAASALNEGVFAEISEISDASLRSIICVSVGEQAFAAAQILNAALGPKLPCPVIITEELPGWFGPLDLIVILSDTADALKASTAINLAARRSGIVVLDAPYESPLVNLAKTHSGIIIAPAMYQSIGISADLLCLWRHIGVLLAVFMQINDQLKNTIGSLDELADRLDNSALQIGPRADEATNPALALALQMHDHDNVWIYDSDTTRAIAQYAQYIFCSIAAVNTGALSLPHWCQRVLFQSLPGVQRDVFYDPEFDILSASKPVRGFILTAHGRLLHNMALAEAAGDVRAVIDITSKPAESDIDALEGLLVALVYIEVAALITYNRNQQPLT